MPKTKLIALIIVVAGALLSPIIGRAATISHVIAADQVVSDNYVQAGNTITIDGTIQGDAILAGDRVIVNGHIEGDLLVLANSTLVNGTIDGNLRGAAGDMTVRGSVAKNVTVAANDLEITERGQIGQSLAYAAGAVNMAGVVAGHVTGQSFSLAINGQVGRDANVTLSNGDLTIGPAGQIKGRLRYGSNSTAAIDAAKISGPIEYHKTTDPITGLKDLLKISTPLITIINYLALLLVGFMAFALFPRGCEHIHQAMMTRPTVKIGWGIVIFLAFPIILAVLLITVIGIPLALILLGLYLVFLYAAPVFVGLTIGQFIFKLVLPARTLGPAIWLVVGLAIYTTVTWLPFIGWLVGLAGTVWFLGGIVLRKIASMKESHNGLIPR